MFQYKVYQREYKKKLRVGIVGAGSHMYRNLLPALHYLPVELVAICNRGEQKLKDTIREYHCNGYTHAIDMYKNEDLDAVLIAVSFAAHPSLVCEAMENHVHVFVEKPLTDNVNSVYKMIEVSKKYDRKVVIGYKKTFMPATRKAAELLSMDKYALPSSALAIYPLYFPQNPQDALSKHLPNEWLKNGSHPLSLLLALFGKVETVTTLCNKAGFGIVQLRFQHGIIANLHLAEGEIPVRDEYRIYGKGWSIDINGSDTIVLHRGIVGFNYDNTTSFTSPLESGGDIVWHPYTSQASPENKALFVQGIVQELSYFCKCIIDDEKPTINSLTFALEITKIYEASMLSCGEEIKIN